MSNAFDDALTQGFNRMASGSNEFDLSVGEDGMTSWVPRAVEPTRAEIAESPEVTSVEPMIGATGRPDPSYMLGRAELPIEEQKAMFEREAFQAVGAPLGFTTSVLLTLPDLVSLPPLIAAGMITADEGKKLEGVLEMLKLVPSAMVGEKLKEQGKNLGFSDEQVEAFGEGYLGGELSSIVVNAVPGAKQLLQGAKWLKDSAVDYAAGAPARVAERGTGTTLQSGIDPVAAVDEAIVGVQNVFGKAPEGVVLKPASDAPKVNQLSPEYRVTVEGFVPEGTGKQAFIPKAITPKNFEQSSVRLDELATEFPDPLSSPESYALMMAKTNNRAEVQAPPTWMIEHANDPEKFADWFKQLTPNQIQAADEGLAIQSKFQDAYKAGAGPQVTGQLMLWSILSRMLSAFPHESGYKDLAKAAVPFVDKAAAGNWEKADTDAWLQLVKKTIPADSPGRSATSNANDFGKVFLAKMAQTDASGKSGLTRLHELMANPDISSKEIRRQFYGIAQDTGIKNKILSFALLVSGRNDVVVLDRIQINRMWAGGNKVYDDVASQFDGAQGLVHYEALERSLANKVPELYSRVGRGDQGSVGRYHWESWVLSSGQVVAHPTLEGVVRTAKGAGVENIPVKEGRFHQRRYGAEYEKLPGGGHRYVYRTSEGLPFEFTKESLDKMFDQAFKKSSGVLPPDFPGVKAFEGTSTPWYEYKGVDRGKLDELIRSAGNPIE